MPFLAQEHFPIPTKDISSWTFDEVRHDWDEPIYIDGNNPKNSISTHQALKLTRKLAAGFKAIGAQRGDCICINSFNDIHYPIFFHGLVAAGLVFSGVNPAYTSYELAHTLKIAKVKYILTQPDMLERVIKAAEEVGLPKKNILIFNPYSEEAPTGFTQWSDLLQHGERDWEHFDDLERSSNTPVARLFSSGTTGLPKAADLTHYNLIAQHTLIYDANPRDWRMARVLNLPMFHAATIPSAFTSTLRDGGKGVVFPRFEPESWFRAHERFGITDLTVVPPMAIMAINHPLKDVCSLKSVKVANVGAAPLDKHPQSRLQALLGEDVPFTQVWGMTETSCVATR
jgi:acyl-CoA synthetase (AMP-forming)/AMP-acid ligase II